ncbi:PucR C-terminal helix-turn-helix domain-containing protein [Actinacidiphila alni]|uniref:PucR C-terminal helix-turn-helix domain-containing protein n=1 Tax=Actinacidiphila alni TaxID=380248 RepID=A0A1I2LBW9_9ACTN|nr:helix-turn-helix domain-containing protein [Actinacidiphila alni]SFF74576.1 PucR C-terminal helix-turn-helix domain-containing protein [Actinacidiphila alni]
MLDLSGLVAAWPERLRLLRPEGGSRAVVGVWPANGIPARREGWRDMLAVVEPVNPGQAVSLVDAVATAGAAGIVTDERAPTALLAAARARRLPVVVARELSVAFLAGAVAELRFAEQAAAAERSTLLLRFSQELTGAESAAPLLQWLASEIGGQAILVMPYQTPSGPVGQEEVPGSRLEAVAEGSAFTDAYDTVDDWSVRLYGLAPEPPRSVLVVARRGGWPSPVSEAVSQTERLLTSWLGRRSSAEAERAPVRSSIVQMLLDGQIAPARRAAAALHLGAALFNGARAQVLVVSVRSPRRKVLAAALHQRLGADALVVPSPDDERHIVVVADDAERPRAAVRGILASHPGIYVGASRSAAVGDGLAEAYEQAQQAVTMATDLPDRWAAYDPAANLASALPSAPAHQWSGALLRPLAEWEPGRRGTWLETTRVALAVGIVAAARKLGADRTTIRSRAEATAGAVGLDWSSQADRIRLDIALRVDRLRLRAPVSSVPTTLADLLATDEARIWAHGLFGRLGEDLHEFAVAWLTAGQSTHRTAEDLHLHPKTVRKRLREIEAALKRPLIQRSGSSDGTNQVNAVHDLFLAATVTGELDGPLL